MEIDNTQFEQTAGAHERLKKAGIVLLAILVLMILGVGGAVLLHELHQHNRPPGSFVGLRANSRSPLKAFLGAQVQDLGDEVARQFGLQQPGGVLVSAVIIGSPAEAAGVQQGDIILEYGRCAVQSVADLCEMLSQSSPGDEVRLLLDSGGRQRQLYVGLASAPVPADDATLVADLAQPWAAEDAASAWGMTIAPLSPLHAQEQNAPADVTGVVVLSVDPGGAAAAAGLQPGDIIAAVNRRSVDDLASFYVAIAEGDDVLLELYRSGRPLYASVAADPARPPTTGVGALRSNAPAVGKIVIATDDDSFDGDLAMFFARAPYFLIVDPSTNSATAVENPYATDGRGIGIFAAQLAINQDAAAVITGRIGPRALDVLQQANVTVYASLVGTAGDALTRYQRGELVPTTTASAPGYGYAQRTMGLTTGSSSRFAERHVEIDVEGGDVDIEMEGGHVHVCPSCGTVVVHPGAVACASLTCPACGTALVSSNYGVVTAGSLPNRSAPGEQEEVGVVEIETADGQELEMEDSHLCVCPSCGTAIVHPRAVACASLKCSVCGTPLVSSNSSPAIPGPPQSTAPPARRPPVAARRALRLPARALGTGVVVAQRPSGGLCRKCHNCPWQARQARSQGGLGQSQRAPAPAPQGTSVGQQMADGNNNGVQLRLCPACGTIVFHPPGAPSSSLNCPACGSKLTMLDAAMSTNATPPNPALMSGGQAQASAPTLTWPAGNGLWTSTDGMAVWLCPLCRTMMPRAEEDTNSTTPCPSCGTQMLPATAGISLAPSSTQLSASTSPPGLLTDEAPPAPTAANASTVAIPTTGRSTSSAIAPLFDRAPFFLILGLGTFRVVPNPNVNDAQGVGIQSAQLVVSEGASAVIADNMSLEAMQALSDLRVKVYAGVKGTADQGLTLFFGDRLSETSVASADAGGEGEGEKAAL